MGEVERTSVQVRRVRNDHSIFSNISRCSGRSLVPPREVGISRRELDEPRVPPLSEGASSPRELESYTQTYPSEDEVFSQRTM